MKLVPNHRLAAQRGTTLIELSVVIAVILLLVGVLFVGITGWKNAANQSACILNISTAQKAVRSYASANSLNPGDACTMATLVSAGYFAAAPTCPGSGTYTPTGTVPAVGAVYLSCSVTGHAPNPATTGNW
jgi:prepilin-type N-terminal cleavage/methylation domain-containing protein